MIRFGIVGCGMIARFHAKALAEIEQATLVACCSRTAAAAEAFAEEFSCRSFDSIEAMLENTELDAVCICTPSGAHLEPAVVAAQHQKHVMVEKPLEVTPARCDAIIEACRDHGVLLGGIFQSRFLEASQAIKAAVDAGHFGVLSVASASIKWYRSQEYYDSGAWRGTWALDGGGALMNQAIHTVDLLQWVMGPIARVAALSALRAHERIEVEDTLVAAVEFANGALGTITATTASWPGWLRRLEISGSTGSCILEDDTIAASEFTRQGLKLSPTQLEAESDLSGGATDPAAIGHAGHRRQLEDFVNAIRSHGKPAVDGAEGRKSVEIICAIYESIRKESWVRLEV